VFIGHFALAFAAKRAAPDVSLGTLFMATQLPDLVWPVLVLLGVERVEVRTGITAFTPLDFVSYPYSHSLVALLAWSALLAAAYLARHRTAVSAALVLAALVLSHWVLDVVSHRPDMPLTLTGDARLGLGLWNSIPATLVVEGTLFAFGVVTYLRSTEPAGRAGQVALGSLVGFLVIVYLASAFGPPPPSSAAVAWSAQALWLLVAWAWWADRHRRPRAAQGATAHA
jgi:hypothetical protein